MGYARLSRQELERRARLRAVRRDVLRAIRCLDSAAAELDQVEPTQRIQADVYRRWHECLHAARAVLRAGAVPGTVQRRRARPFLRRRLCAGD